VLFAPGVDDLAEFTGRPIDSFGPFADTALAQATLLFQVVTSLTEFPTDEIGAQLATNAILEMAYRFILEQPYAITAASPFQSETIGSYSYSKSGTARLALLGKGTGLLWWDLAMDRLTRPGESGVGYGSISAFRDHLVTDGTGQVYIVDPTEAPDTSTDLPPYVRIG
jgi:hypothetical protein